jgi:hypothetical protein
MAFLTNHVDTSIDWASLPKSVELPRMMYESVMGKELMRTYNYKKKTGGFVDERVSCIELPKGYEHLPEYKVMRLLLDQIE